MNQNRRYENDDEPAFDMASFSTEPPPAGAPSDVHNAQTAVAALPDSFLVDLLKGKPDPITARYNVLADVDVVETSTPTEAPPPVPTAKAAPAVAPAPALALVGRPAAPALDDPSDRLSELTAAVTAALAAAARVTPEPRMTPEPRFAPEPRVTPPPMALDVEIELATVLEPAELPSADLVTPAPSPVLAAAAVFLMLVVGTLLALLAGWNLAGLLGAT
jgi:hypothetical protein